MTRRTLAIGWFALALGSGLSCSWLTKPEQGGIHCKITDKVDPCPDGTYCVNETCQPEGDCKREECGDGEDNDCDGQVDEFSDASVEICDTYDNDCDGETDEDYDLDKDGWSICGEGNFEDGTYDCEANLKDVHPGAVEVCDGLDNDCVNGPDVNAQGEPPPCPSGEQCLNGRCVAPTCAEKGSGVTCRASEKCIDGKCVTQACSPACKDNEQCDPKTLTCMAQPLKKAGDGCVVPSDCDQSTVKLMCFDRAALKLTHVSTRGVCGIGCCSDSDCGTNETCYVSGTGARSCLPKTIAINVANPLRCTNNENCAPANQFCAAQALGSEIASTACRPPTANSSNERKIGELCAMSSQCTSRMCVDGNVLQKLCSAPCRDSSDCREMEAPVNRGITFTTATPYCQYVKLGTFDAGLGDNYAPICLVARGQEIGSGKNGAECYFNRECASGVCIGASPEGKGRCAQTCCSDAQCAQGAAGAPAMRCQPVARGKDSFEMRCLPGQ